MDPARATYDKNGALVCPSCAATATIAEGDARAASSMVGTAIGVLAGGVLSWTCLNMFWILSIATLLAGIGWLVTVWRNPSLRDRLGGKLVPCIVATSIGVLAAAVPLLSLLGLGAAILRR
jgi:hypothetical protein